MEGLISQNGVGTMSASTIVPSEKKAELHKQLMKTYQLQPTESLRKNSSAKFNNKNRESNTPSHLPSNCKPASRHNMSTDRLTLDVPTDSFVDLKKQRSDPERPRSKNKKLGCDSKGDTIPEEVYLFSNENLRDIASLPAEQKPKKCFSKKRPLALYK